MSTPWTNSTKPRQTSLSAAVVLVDSRAGFLRNNNYSLPRLSFLNQNQRRDARVRYRV